MSRALLLPPSAARLTERSAFSETRLISGIGSAPGESGLRSQASVQAERSWRAGLPVRVLTLTASRLEASIIFSRKISLVSLSRVASHTEPVHTPAAPIAMQAAI